MSLVIAIQTDNDKLNQTNRLIVPVPDQASLNLSLVGLMSIKLPCFKFDKENESMLRATHCLYYPPRNVYNTYRTSKMSSEKRQLFCVRIVTPSFSQQFGTECVCVSVWDRWHGTPWQKVGGNNFQKPNSIIPQIRSDRGRELLRCLVERSSASVLQCK